MALYRQILSEADVTRALASRETYELDFKKSGDPKKYWEMAKDIAGFANYVGGVLLVGVDELPDGTGQLRGLSQENCEHLRDGYVEAAKYWCQPSPLISPQVIHCQGHVVLAVNVEPAPGMLIAAAAVGYDQARKLKKIDNAWRYYLRVANSTEALKPAHLPLFFDARIRRLIIALDEMATMVNASKNEIKGTVYHRMRGRNAFMQEQSIIEMQLNERGNSVTLMLNSAAPQRISVPLDEVDTAWYEPANSTWYVRIRGEIYMQKKPWRYYPWLNS